MKIRVVERRPLPFLGSLESPGSQTLTTKLSHGDQDPRFPGEPDQNGYIPY